MTEMYDKLDADQTATEIESLCMNCHQNGTTRLLLTEIPHFRQVIIMAFECLHCGVKNNELQSAMIQPGGCNFTLNVKEQRDLNRQIVRSDYAVIKFPEIQLELPASKRSTLTTVEGLITHIMEDLGSQQPVRMHTEPELHQKIETLIGKLREYLEMEKEFVLEMDDPSGNSYIENLYLPKEDPRLKMKVYERTPEMETALGMQPPPEDKEEKEAPKEDPIENDEVFHFPAQCSACHQPSETRMRVLDIPHFKEVVIMSTACELCGYKSNEIKSSGAVSPLGKRISLNMTSAEDLSRDILKSETCGLVIPEIDLELNPGTLGGRFTTVEGLLTQVHDELADRFVFSKGDSAPSKEKSKFQHFLARLQEVIKGESRVTLVLDDPLANSYLQNLYAPDPDPNMTTEEYERSFMQNEELGLNDIQTEDYKA